MELKDAVAAIIKDTVKNMDLTDVSYATVVSLSPVTLEIQATQLQVSQPVVILTENVMEQTATITIPEQTGTETVPGQNISVTIPEQSVETEISGETVKIDIPSQNVNVPVSQQQVSVTIPTQTYTIVVNPGLAVGDKVMALKANNGQNYIVISKV